ncbi:MAG: TRAP transporter fused permease subunit [Rhizobiales bacterium]|nr:TRAP transporter fused permease subunit [Hyphomicrobiales bacterium]
MNIAEGNKGGLESPAENRRTRSLRGALARVVRLVSVTLAIYVAVYVSTLFDLAGIQLYGSHRALVYSGILFLLFMLYPGTSKGPWNRVPWYDFVLAFFGVTASLYAFISWDKWSYGVTLPTWQEELLAVALIAVSLEGARRVLGWAFVAVGLAFIIYPLFGKYLPGMLATPPYSLSQLTQFFYLAGGGSGIFGGPMEIFTTTVAVFLLFGAFLQHTGAAGVFIDAAVGIAGRFRGGMAKVAVVASSLFGLISGVGAANVLVTGSFTIPAMKRLGYRPSFAAAVEASASTGGILMPPVMGAAAFLMADILGVSYWSIALAAVLPGILYYVAMFTMVDFEGGRTGLRGIPTTDIPPLRKTLSQGWFLIASIVVLLTLMGYFGHPVDQSALIATVVLVALAFVPTGRLRFSGLIKALDDGGRLLAEIGAAGAVVGIIMSGFTLTGLGAFLPTVMQALSGDNLFLLLLFAAAASIVLGMGAPPLLVYVLLAATVAPTIIQFGVSPIAAHMFIFYFGLMSMLTPPVALSSLIAARLAGAGFWQTSIEAVRLAIVAFIIPFFFVYQPALLMQGSFTGTAIAVATALLGVVALSGALTRYLFIRELTLPEAFVVGVGGLLLLYPEHYSDVVGFVLVVPSIVGTVFVLVRRRRKEMLQRSMT